MAWTYRLDRHRLTSAPTTVGQSALLSLGGSAGRIRTRSKLLAASVSVPGAATRWSAFHEARL